MPDRTCVLTQPRYLSLSEAKHACYTACDLTHMHLACACLQTLLARQRRPHEDDANTCDGLTALFGLIADSLLQHEADVMDALQETFEVVDREIERAE